MLFIIMNQIKQNRVRILSNYTVRFSDNQCWEGYFGNVIGYRLQVTDFQKRSSSELR